MFSLHLTWSLKMHKLLFTSLFLEHSLHLALMTGHSGFPSTLAILLCRPILFSLDRTVGIMSSSLFRTHSLLTQFP